jgi:hypothetical protein
VEDAVYIAQAPLTVVAGFRKAGIIIPKGKGDKDCILEYLPPSLKEKEKKEKGGEDNEDEEGEETERKGSKLKKGKKEKEKEKEEKVERKRWTISGKVVTDEEFLLQWEEKEKKTSKHPKKMKRSRDGRIIRESKNEESPKGSNLSEEEEEFEEVADSSDQEESIVRIELSKENAEPPPILTVDEIAKIRRETGDEEREELDEDIEEEQSWSQRGKRMLIAEDSEYFDRVDTTAPSPQRMQPALLIGEREKRTNRRVPQRFSWGNLEGSASENRREYEGQQKMDK